MSYSIRIQEMDDEKLSTPTHEEIKSLTELFLSKFLKLYSCEDVTPSLHLFVHHLHELYKDNGDINLFNCQGSEKLNDLTTTIFFKSTNKKDNLREILNHQLRIEKLETIVFLKPKRPYIKKIKLLKIFCLKMVSQFSMIIQSQMLPMR